METSLTVNLFKQFNSFKKFNESRADSNDLNDLNDSNNFMRSSSVPPARNEPASFTDKKARSPTRQTDPSDRESGSRPQSDLPVCARAQTGLCSGRSFTPKEG